MNQVYQKARLTIDSISWTPIAALMSCNNIAIRNLGAVDVKLRTDQADPNTEDTLAAGVQEGAVGGSRYAAGMGFRFPTGTVLLYAQATSGIGPLMVTCLE